jgi:hypothetical protein
LKQMIHVTLHVHLHRMAQKCPDSTDNTLIEFY